MFYQVLSVAVSGLFATGAVISIRSKLASLSLSDPLDSI